MDGEGGRIDAIFLQEVATADPSLRTMQVAARAGGCVFTASSCPNESGKHTAGVAVLAQRRTKLATCTAKTAEFG
eukprot:1215064-Alexandrium_andersonii.AAC.1